MPARRPEYLIVGGCPCPRRIAPHIHLVTAGKANSIYRGSDARALLHDHGKRTQAEIHADPALANSSNPEGESTHDGHTGGAYPGPKTQNAEWWQQGFDVNDWEVDDCIRRARELGWELFQPYPGTVEAHHLNFRRPPRSRGRLQRRIRHIRRHLPSR